MNLRRWLGLALIAFIVSTPLSAQVEKVVADSQGIT
jgi:hypothetical protein